MTAETLFYAIGHHIRPLLDEEFRRRDLCILSTRIAIDVAEYFGIAAAPLTTRAIVANKQWTENAERGYFKNGGAIRGLTDGSWAVGIGWNQPGETEQHRWNGHLVAFAHEWFGDFSISAAERPAYEIFTGAAIIGRVSITDKVKAWTASTDNGVSVMYERITNEGYRQSPDWKDEKRRRPIVAQLIREIKRGTNGNHN